MHAYNKHHQLDDLLAEPATHSPPRAVMGSVAREGGRWLWVLARATDPQTPEDEWLKPVPYSRARTRKAAQIAAILAARALGSPYYRTGPWLAEARREQLLIGRRRARVARRAKHVTHDSNDSGAAMHANNGNGAAVVDATTDAIAASAIPSSLSPATRTHS